MNFNKKYLKMDLSKIKHTQGISAISSVFTNFLRLSKYLNLEPIYPEFILSGYHNYGKPTMFIEYINLPDNVKIESECNSTDENTLIWKVENEWMLSDNFYQQYKDKIQKMKFLNFSIKKQFEILGKKIIDTFKRPICCVHVRRNDYLNIRNSLKLSTMPSAILSKIESLEKNISTVYIMTDETDPTFFDLIKTKYNVKLYVDIAELEQLKKEDNYKLFLVETYIRDMSDLRISTFKSSRNNYYNTYLDEIEGWQ